MNIEKTIQNIRKTCTNYVDPDLLVFIINDDNLMGTNNILEINDFNISDDDSYEERLLKIHKKKNIFLPVGMMLFTPIINECDLFCQKDYNFKLSKEEFEKYYDEKERLFGILIKKNSDEYLIGKTDTCSCSIDSAFEELEKTDLNFYTTIEKIINEKIEK